jgi:hypothetical protein
VCRADAQVGHPAEQCLVVDLADGEAVVPVVDQGQVEPRTILPNNSGQRVCQRSRAQTTGKRETRQKQIGASLFYMGVADAEASGGP